MTEKAKRWLERAYPGGDEGMRKAAAESDLAAAEHSLRKWRNLRLSVLGEYGVSRGYLGIFDSENNRILGTSSSSCSLCLRHGSHCDRCPIFRVSRDTCHFQYAIFIDDYNPEPMIALLEKTVAMLKKKTK